MIQVLEKVSDILDLLSQNQGRELSLSVIADKLKINRATCANILKSLRDLEYVQQPEYRGGYMLGDKIYSLAGLRSEANILRTKIKPILDALCREENENLMLAVIKGSKRELIYTVKGNNQIEAKSIDTMDIWPATTAKVIISHYSSKQLSDLLKLIGMPGKQWPEVNSREELEEELEKIRTAPYTTVIFNHFACIVAPVFKKGEIVASIAMYLPDLRLTDNRQEILEGKVVDAAARASSIL